MVNYCGKCGRPLNKKTGLCPNCDKKKTTPKRKLLFSLIAIFAIVALGIVGIQGWKQNEMTPNETPGQIQSIYSDNTYTTEVKIICGQNGEPMSHTWKVANYQHPKICLRCGVTEGMPLTPAFIQHNIPGQFMELGKAYSYVTNCYQDSSKQTTAQLEVTNYQIVDSDETHAAKDGHEWRIADVEIVASDENVKEYGINWGYCHENYYDVDAFDDTSVWNQDMTSCTFTVNWNGVEFTNCELYCTLEPGTWTTDYKGYDLALVKTVRTEFLVPKGYDGCIIGFYDATTKWETGMHIYDIADYNTLFFRLT